MKRLTASTLVEWFPLASLLAGLIPLAVDLGGANLYPNALLTVGVAGLISAGDMIRRFRAKAAGSLYAKLLLALIVLYAFSLWHVFAYKNYALTFAYFAAYAGSAATYFVVSHLIVRRGDGWEVVAARFSRNYLIFSFGLTVLFLVPDGAELLRSSVLQFNRNDYAMVMLQGLSLVLGRVLAKRGYTFREIVLGSVLVVGLLLSANRGAVIGLWASLPVLIVLSRQVRLIKKFYLILISALILLILVLVQHRLVQSFINPGEYQDVARVAILGVARQIFVENWMFGVGVGNYWDAYLHVASTSAPLLSGLPSNIYDAVYRIARPPHDLYVRVGVELGIGGVIVLALANVSACIYFIRRLRSGGIYSHAGLIYAIGYTVHSFVYEGYIYPFHFIFLGVLMSATAMSASTLRRPGVSAQSSRVDVSGVDERSPRHRVVDFRDR